MRLIKHDVERKQNGRVAVVAQWRDQMRRPANVMTKVVTGELASDSAVTLVEGSAEEVAGIMFAQAEIAWDMGWRPRGLIASLAGYVQGFKLPPEAR